MYYKHYFIITTAITITSQKPKFIKKFQARSSSFLSTHQSKPVQELEVSIGLRDTEENLLSQPTLLANLLIELPTHKTVYSSIIIETKY